MWKASFIPPPIKYHPSWSIYIYRAGWFGRGRRRYESVFREGLATQDQSTFQMEDFFRGDAEWIDVNVSEGGGRMTIPFLLRALMESSISLECSLALGQLGVAGEGSIGSMLRSAPYYRLLQYTGNCNATDHSEKGRAYYISATPWEVMSVRDRQPAENYFPITLDELPDAWNGFDPESGDGYLNTRERAIEAYVGWDSLGDRPKMSSSTKIAIVPSRWKHHAPLLPAWPDLFTIVWLCRKPIGKDAIKEAAETCRKIQSVSYCLCHNFISRFFNNIYSSVSR